MPIEVRQLLIKATVDGSAGQVSHRDAPDPQLDQLRDSILEDCKAWLEDKLEQMRER